MTRCIVAQKQRILLFLHSPILCFILLCDFTNFFFFWGYILSFWVIKFCVHCLNKKMELGLSLTYLYRKKKKKILTQALAFYEKKCRSIINLLVNGQILKQRYLIDHRKFNESDRQQSISHVSNWIPLNYL